MDTTTLFSKKLAESGYRLTESRRAIVQALVACGGHITADELAARVHKTAPGVGRMSVYRTLELLCELGLVRPIYQGTGAAHYILLDGGSHHHLICNRCGLVIEFDHCAADEVGQILSTRFNFQIQSHLLEFHGLCTDCQTGGSKGEDVGDRLS